MSQENEERDQTVNKQIPCFNLIPCFNYFQLYLIGLGYFPFSNRLLAQQYNNYSKEDITSNKNFNLNNAINKQGMVNRNDQFDFLIENICFAIHMNSNSDENTNTNSDENTNTNSEDELGPMRIKDKLLDSNYFLSIIEDFNKLLAAEETPDYINLDEVQNIEEYLACNSYDSNVKLFYSREGRNPDESANSNLTIPIEVPVKKKYNFNWKKAKFNKISEKVGSRMNKKFELSLLIGSKGNLPVLILGSKGTFIKIYDNNSKIVKDIEYSINKLDSIRVLMYRIEGLDCEIKTTFVTSRRSHNCVKKTDEALKEIIQYKYENFWNKKEFTFIEMIVESIRYPAFFAFCCNFDQNVAYIGSIALATDQTSANELIEGYQKKNVKLANDLNDFVRCYGNFTYFARLLIQFLVNIKDDKESISLLISVFSTIPAFNLIMFNAFIQFLLGIKKISNKSVANEIQQLINCATEKTSINYSMKFIPNQITGIKTPWGLTRKYMKLNDEKDDLGKLYYSIMENVEIKKFKLDNDDPDYVNSLKYKMEPDFAHFLVRSFYNPLIKV